MVHKLMSEGLLTADILDPVEYSNLKRFKMGSN